MNALLLLMGLLLLSYIGSFLVGGRALRGYGLPSGSEYLLLGFVVGPHALGLVERSMLDSFEPIATVALGWLGLVIGLDYAFLGRRRVRLTSWFLACLFALITGSAVAAAVYAAASRVAPLHGAELLLVAGGAGAACAETTRHAVRWVVERHHARGRLADLLAEIADSDDLLPLAATTLLFAFFPSQKVQLILPEVGWAGLTLGIGAVLGTVTAALLGREFRLYESWGVLLGTSLFAIGLTARLDLSFVAMMFFMGITIAALSRHREEVAAMVAPTERPVLLPALLLAGARIDPAVTPGLVWIAAAALAARTVAKLASGLLLWSAFAPARNAGPAMGLGLMSAGALAMAIGLSFALRFPGPVGDTVLSVVAVVTVFGEFVGPARLRAALQRAGEIEEPAAVIAVGQGDGVETGIVSP